MIGRKAVSYRFESFCAFRKRKYIFVYRKSYHGVLSLAVKHTDFGGKAQSSRAVILCFAPVGETLYIFFYFRHGIGDGAVYFLHGIGGKENAVILKEYQPRRFARLCPVCVGALFAERGEYIAGFCGFHPYRVGEKHFACGFSVFRAGYAVYSRGMNMKHIFIREQVVKQRFHAGALCFLARAFCRHHIGKHLRFPLGFVFGIFLFEHGGKLFPVHSDKSVFVYRGESRARAFYIENIVGFIRCIAAARENKFGICSVAVRHFDERAYAYILHCLFLRLYCFGVCQQIFFRLGTP